MIELLRLLFSTHTKKGKYKGGSAIALAIHPIRFGAERVDNTAVIKQGFSL